MCKTQHQKQHGMTRHDTKPLSNSFTPSTPTFVDGKMELLPNTNLRGSLQIAYAMLVPRLHWLGAHPNVLMWATRALSAVAFACLPTGKQTMVCCGDKSLKSKCIFSEFFKNYRARSFVADFLNRENTC
jgi:hypothetical protein